VGVTDENKWVSPMGTYEFSIIASGLAPASAQFEDRFYRAGCDDATVCYQGGRIIVAFTREGETLHAAVSSAIECVEAAGAVVEEVERYAAVGNDEP
jgi:hypothetical protein